jgi:hypothetical protein
MGRWGLADSPGWIYDRVVKIAQEKDVVAGRRMRVDTTDGDMGSTAADTKPTTEGSVGLPSASSPTIWSTSAA